MEYIFYFLCQKYEQGGITPHCGAEWGDPEPPPPQAGNLTGGIFLKFILIKDDAGECFTYRFIFAQLY